MKKIGVCPKCHDKFECTNDNEYSYGYYKCPQGHLSNTCDLNTDYFPLTVDEAQEYAEFLEKGETHKYHIGVVGRKVGDIINCKKCGKITSVVEYDGLTNDKNTFIECTCEANESDKRYEPCGDSDCELHKDICFEKFKKEEEEHEVKRKLIKEILEKYPPKNDGILELNRIIFLFSNCYIKDNTGGYFISVHDEFTEYCAKHDLLKTNHFV